MTVAQVGGDTDEVAKIVYELSLGLTSSLLRIIIRAYLDLRYKTIVIPHTVVGQSLSTI